MSNPYQPPPQQPSGQQPGYPQQGQPTQGYGQAQPYGQQSYPASAYQQPAAPAKTGGIMGLIGLVLVLAGLIGGLVLAFLSVDSVVGIVQRYGSSGDFSTLPQSDPDVQSFTILLVIYAVACLVGTVGWVLSIVGTVRKATRPAGIAGIIIGVLALPIQFGVWVAMISSSVGALM